MKKLLLSMILGFFTCASFAYGKNDNAQLLAHLKNIKEEIIVDIEQDLLDGLSYLSQEETTEYHFFVKLVGEFYNKTEILQRIVTDEIIHPEFNVICENMSLSFNQIQSQNKFDNLPTYQRMKAFIPVEGGFKAQYPVEIREDVRSELFDLFVPVFKSVYQEHLTMGRYDIFEERITDKLEEVIFEEVLDCIMRHPEMLGNDWPILKLIDAKIAELEAHV